MATLLTLLCLLVIIGFLAYQRASLLSFTLVVALALLLATLNGKIHELGWLPFVAIAAALNIRLLRQQYLSKPMLALYRRLMPAISATEQEAIDAGTTWWEAELFRGAPDWHQLQQTPAPRLTAEEQAFVDGPVEQLCRMCNDWETTHERADLTPAVWAFLKEHRFFAMIIAKEYGGLAFSAYAQSCVLKKLAGVSSVLASTVGVPNSLGPAELLQRYGTDEQKNHYLPKLACGEEIPCFALTSPEAGSDAGAIPDVGIVCHGQWQGQQIVGMRLTWNKRYITLAPVATVLGLAFKLADPDHLLGDKVALGITCALIPTGTPGVEIGRRHLPLNIPFQNGPTHGEQVFVPLDYIIGGPQMAGQGWRMLVECLSVGRAITLPSNSTGSSKMAAMATGAYARIRRQFQRPIGKMEGIEEPLARIGGNTYLMEAATTMTVGAIDIGEKPAVISAIVKRHLTERNRQVMTDAMDIHGGKGIMQGPNNYLARAYQSAPIGVTVEGANILTRSMIIYGQGAIRCHPYLLREIQAATRGDPQQALVEFDQALFSHIGFAISNLFRSLWLGLTGGRTSASPVKDATRRYYQQINRFSAALALLSDVTLVIMGGQLKHRQRISARLGDLLSQLYLSCATLKRYQDEGRQTDDLPLLHWAVQDSLYQAQSAIDELLRNFPNRPVAAALRILILPLGRTLRGPSDKLEHQAARLLMIPGDTRCRLGHGQYLTREPGNPAGMLEQTLEDILAVEPIFTDICHKLREKRPFMQLDTLADEALSRGLISTEEAELMRRAEKGRLAAINVDDFAPQALAAGQLDA